MIHFNNIQIQPNNTRNGRLKKVPLNSFMGNKCLNKHIPVMVQYFKPDSISFGKMAKPNLYDGSYDKYGYNGETPDTYILNKIKELLPIKKILLDKLKGLLPITKNYNYGITVLDLGAGDGRNSIPLAKAGYDVKSLELSDNGIKLINESAKDKGLENNITTIKADILNNEGLKLNNFDFVLMDHVSQHFTEEELDNAFKNISESLKSGGFFVFDALIKQKGCKEHHIVDNQFRQDGKNYSAENNGYVNFNQNFINKLIEKHNFELVEDPSIYDEPHYQRASYIDVPMWGLGSNSPVYLNVKLKWFVLRKK